MTCTIVARPPPPIPVMAQKNNKLKCALRQGASQGAKKENEKSHKENQLSRPYVAESAIEELEGGRCPICFSDNSLFCDASSDPHEITICYLRCKTSCLQIGAKHCQFPSNPLNEKKEETRLSPSHLIIGKLTASVVWSMRATKSTLAQARKTFMDHLAPHGFELGENDN